MADGGLCGVPLMLLQDNDLEASAGEAREAIGLPARSRRRARHYGVAGLTLLGAGAGAAALAATVRGSAAAAGLPVPAGAPLEGHQPSQLWNFLRWPNTCPPPDDFCGANEDCGYPRDPEFATVEQAFHCLDLDGNQQLSAKEIASRGKGRHVTAGAKRTRQGIGNLSLFYFQDGVRQYRDALNARQTIAGVKVRHWTEHLLKNARPRSEDFNAHEHYPPYRPPAHGVGKVSLLYSFGAPAISWHPLWNAATPTGCFPGLRIYNQGSVHLPEYGFRLHLADPASWLLTAFGFVQPKMNVLALHEDNAIKADLTTCLETSPRWMYPQPDMFFWWIGHSPTGYEDNIDELAQIIQHKERFAKGWDRAAKVQGSSTSGEGAVETLHEGPYKAEDNLNIGDTIRVSSNQTLLRDAFRKTYLGWRPELQQMMGQNFRVLGVPRPGMVRLPAHGGGHVDFPIETLSVVKEVGAPTGAVAAEADAAQTSKHIRNRTKLLRRVERLEEARQAAHLSLLSYSTVPQVHADLQGTEWTMVKRVFGGQENATLTLFQKAESMECAVVFGMRHWPTSSPRFQSAFVDGVTSIHTKQRGEDEGRLAQNLFYWYEKLAGDTPKYFQQKQTLSSGERTFYEPFTSPKFTNHSNLSLPPGMSGFRDMADFCGFPKVQAQLRRAIVDLINSPGYTQEIQTRLPACSAVAATGHDVGGALATLWTACANRGLEEGHEGYAHYKATTWNVGTPRMLHRLMRRHTTRGTAVRDRATGMQLEVTGSITDAELDLGSVQLAPAWNREPDDRQTWDLLPNGTLRNRYTRQCMSIIQTPDGNPLGASTHVEDCHPGVWGAAQRWRLTRRGFLVSTYSGLCMSTDMTLRRCPMTDQMWHRTPDGFIVNRISGKCLDVAGSSGSGSGDKLVVSECAFGNNNTDQLWDLAPGGGIRNRHSSKCLDVSHLRSVEHGGWSVPSLVLFNCSNASQHSHHKRFNAQSWAWTHSGFIINRLNGKCVDITGGDEVQDGSSVLLNPCERRATRSSARWKLTKRGALINVGNNFRFRNKCISAFSPLREGLSKLQLEACETGLRQRWNTTADGHIETVIGIDECLTADGTAVKLSYCDRTNRAQIWNRTGEGFLVSAQTEMCVTASRQDKTLKQEHCRMSDQRWMVSPEGKLQSMLSGMCANVKGAQSSDVQPGAHMNVWRCQEGNATGQRWHIAENGQIRSQFGNLCLDVEGHPPAGEQNGASIMVDRCMGGTNLTYQNWELSLTGFLKNRVSGKCLDVKGIAGHQEGQALVLYSCEDDPSFTTQFWDFIKSRGSRPRVPNLPLGRVPREYRAKPAEAGLPKAALPPLPSAAPLPTMAPLPAVAPLTLAPLPTVAPAAPMASVA